MLKQAPKVIILSLVAVGVGLGVAFFTRGEKQIGANTAVTSDGQTIKTEVPSDVSGIKVGDIFGSGDETSFKDNATGYLQPVQDGSSDGSHVLLRPGGVSQTVHLTSSVTDLEKFVGMEVKVWGETFRGRNAGWLMDVGRVEVIKTVGSAPEK